MIDRIIATVTLAKEAMRRGLSLDFDDRSVMHVEWLVNRIQHLEKDVAVLSKAAALLSADNKLLRDKLAELQQRAGRNL